MDVHQIEATAWTALKGLSASKKFQAAVLAAIAWLIGKLGLHMDSADLVPYVAPLWLFIFGQGLADFGKSAALVGLMGTPANDNKSKTDGQAAA